MLVHLSNPHFHFPVHINASHIFTQIILKQSGQTKGIYQPSNFKHISGTFDISYLKHLHSIQIPTWAILITCGKFSFTVVILWLGPYDIKGYIGGDYVLQSKTPRNDIRIDIRAL